MWGRIRQTLQAITAWLRPVNDAVAKTYLNEAEFALFMQMGRSERQHHLRVLKKLLKQGHSQPALWVAALLHDVGKTRLTFSIPERILVVVVKKVSPKRFERWSRAEPRGWKKAFVVSAHHPAWGAEMVEGIGSDSLAVDLIRAHQDKFSHSPQTEFERLLQLLQIADDAS